MKKFHFTLLSMLFFSISSFAQSSQMKTLTVQGFTIDYPFDWIPDTSGNIGSTFFLSSPLLGQEDTYSENINLILQPLPNPKMTLDEYVAESLKQLPFYFADYKLISQEELKKKKNQYHHLEYSGKINGVELYFKQFIWLKNGKSYQLTFTGEGSTFSLYQEISTQIMESLKFN